MTSLARFLFERATLEDIQRHSDDMHASIKLSRALGPVSLTLLGVGNALGAGIFVLTGTAAARYAGPGIALSYVIAGATCLIASLCYAEMSALIPSAGGSFSYARATLGRLPAWLIGWCMIIEYLIAGATVAAGWSGYAQDLLQKLGVTLPASLAQAPVQVHGGSLALSGGVLNVPATLMVLACTWVLARGVRRSDLANTIMVATKVTVIVLVILVGAFYVHPANWRPFIPPTDAAGHFGWHGVFAASAIAFFSYSGFEAMSAAAREARNPVRDLPIALLASILICAILYVGMALVMTGLAPYLMLDTASPVATALHVASPRLAWLEGLVDVGTVVGLGAAVLVSLYGQARTFFAMASVGAMPAAFQRVHPRYQTPATATWVTGAGAALFAGLLPLDLLGELVSMGILIAFASVCLGVLVLRARRAEVHRPFQVPWCPLLPLLGILACIGLMFSLPRITWLNIALWLVVGNLLYFATLSRSSDWLAFRKRAAAPLRPG